MRSQGRVRFVQLSTHVQALAALAILILVGASLATAASLGFAQLSNQHAQATLDEREARVARAQSRLEADRQAIDSVAADLARRQQFIQRMVEAHLGDLPEEPAAADSTASGSLTGKVSAVLPQAEALARVEVQQLAFVDRLTRYAERRSEHASDAIRRLGLSPAAIVASARSRFAEGGPFMRLATSRDGSLDPRFRRLGSSLARMDALLSGLASIPQVRPTHVAYVSSSYGYRADPFNGGAAFHAGLDFPGPMGSAIYAAAKGTVTFVGQKQGYGNCIEVSHGNGLLTRYAHLSRLGARVGQRVDAGAHIGAMGSTGRSTGPHLHFEVRINDRPVNPRPFLEAARHAHEDQLPEPKRHA